MAYKTPGVYVEEISTLPPSVAEVSTAIPAFIGYTETGTTIARVTTLLEYEQLFGGAKPTNFSVVTGTDANGLTTVVSVSRTAPSSGTLPPTPDFLMYYAVSHYFKNGGGPCYIVPVGNYSSTPAATDYTGAGKGLDLLAKEDEPTLIVLTDAVNLAAADYHSVAQAALLQAATLGDRFVILDVKANNDATINDVTTFRTGVGMNSLAYGAAYYPYLQTTMAYEYDETSSVKVNISASGGTSSQDVSMSSFNDTTTTQYNTSVYNSVKTLLAAQQVVLPPSSAIAGIYASVDRDRGVWKAPANVSVNSVIGPVTKVTDSDQENLNIDVTAGKSVNAIRAFTGKGTLVWGARTLAGNDNEWRYISVRRLFNMVEESSKLATGFAVFEPNDITTWLKVKGMIESFLHGLWQQGALAGATPDKAYFVNVGLGKTMTSDDVLNGRMIVEIGLAAVRPAEFIILRFSHLLQEG